METKSEKNIVNILYILLVASTIFSFMPLISAQFLSLVMIIAVLFAAFVFRMGKPEDSLLYNHMTYMIGTVLIGTTIITIGAVIGGMWLFSAADNSAFDNAMIQIQNGTMMDMGMVHAIMADYMMSNKTLLITIGIVTIGPGIAYFIYRVANGYGRAMKGYRIAKPKGWL